VYLHSFSLLFILKILIRNRIYVIEPQAGRKCERVVTNREVRKCKNFDTVSILWLRPSFCDT
jgi:hypothetical protein